MRRKINALFLIAFWGVASARAQWQIVSSENAPWSNGEYRKVELRHATGETATLNFALLSAKTAKLAIIDNAGGENELAAAAARAGARAGVNGGYFDPDFRPLGLRIIDGATTSPMTHARLLTGILCRSERGVQILRVNEFSPKRHYEAALECGPFLVDHGSALKTLDRTRTARRTFAFITRDGKAALGIASDLSLAAVADVLGTPELKISRAMNLDGGSSTAFWCRRENADPISIREFKSVRDFVVFK